jgi:hypothetical protein
MHPRPAAGAALGSAVVTPWLPIAPMPAGAPRATGRVPLRFEDVTQDGRFVVDVLPAALGPTVWRGLLEKAQGFRACFENGVFPILSGLKLEGTAGPFSADGRVEAEGSYRFARAADGRFMLEVWADLYAAIGRTHVRPSQDGERTLAGRVLAEHIFTRPFAPAGQRRVTSFDFDGAPVVSESRPAPPAFESVAELPAGATPLEAARRLDPVPIVFGLLHTDGNMHVNSLAYLRVLEEAALRRFVELGRGSLVLARRIDIAYRKPCFAGQTMRVLQQAFELEGKLGMCAALIDSADVTEGAASLEARPHVFARTLFEA